MDSLKDTDESTKEAKENLYGLLNEVFLDIAGVVTDGKASRKTELEIVHVKVFCCHWFFITASH